MKKCLVLGSLAFAIIASACNKSPSSDSYEYVIENGSVKGVVRLLPSREAQTVRLHAFSDTEDEKPEILVLGEENDSRCFVRDEENWACTVSGTQWEMKSGELVVTGEEDTDFKIKRRRIR